MSAPSATIQTGHSAPLQLDPLTRLWRLFTAVKFAIGLILVLVFLSFVGTAISQVPPPMRADQALVDRWLVATTGRYGALTPLLYQLGAFDVFNTPGFRALLGLITVCVVMCTLNRAPAVWRNVITVPFQRREAYYDKSEQNAQATLDAEPERTLEALRAAWRNLGYRVVVDRTVDAIHVYADRYRFVRLATFVNHLGLIMILASGATTGILGQRNDGLVVPVGSTRPVGLGTDYSLLVENFTDEYYLSGGAKDYRSDVVVYEKGAELRRATIRVNEPLVVGPVKLHQAYFGQAVVVEVKKAGKPIYMDAVPLAYTALPYGFRAVGFFRLPAEGLSIDLVSAENASDPAVRAGQVAIFGYPIGTEAPLFGGLLTQKQPQAWKDLEFTFVRETQFTGIQAVRDPGAPIFFIASALMLGGILAVFYFPHRKLWALIRPTTAGSDVRIAGMCSKNPTFPNEFRVAVEALERSLSSSA